MPEQLFDQEVITQFRINEARKNAIREGRKENQTYIVKRFHSKGLSVSEILDLTGYPLEVIEEVLSQLPTT